MSIASGNTLTAQATLLPDFNSTLKTIAGTATFNQVEASVVEITLKLTGLTPNTEHGWHIHTSPVELFGTNA